MTDNDKEKQLIELYDGKAAKTEFQIAARKRYLEGVSYVEQIGELTGADK